jgi:hypothetical protein
MSTTFDNEFFDKILSEKNRFGFSTQFVDDDDVDCRTIRVFISSTFKDFYNEREVLVTFFEKIHLASNAESKDLHLVREWALLQRELMPNAVVPNQSTTTH